MELNQIKEPERKKTFGSRAYSVYRRFDSEDQWRSMAYSIQSEQGAKDFIKRYASCRSHWQIKQGQAVIDTWLYDGTKFLKTKGPGDKKDVI